jgi:hypothetical protein
MHVQIRLPFFSVFFAVFHTSHRTSLHFICSSFVYQVLSITLDAWSDSDIDSMVEVGGNSYANSIYEAFLPKDHPKPKPDSSMEYRTTSKCSHIIISYLYLYTEPSMRHKIF